MTVDMTLLERAKLGEAEAIAFLLNLAFAKQNQHVDVQAREGQLSISIAASVLPPQESTTRWIASAIAQMNVPKLQTIFIGARLARLSGQNRTESSLLVWQQSIQFFPNSSQIDPFNSSIDIRQPEPSIDLSECCFIRNKSLLKGTLAIPSKLTTQFVLSFSALPNSCKLEVIPHIHDFLFRLEDAADHSFSKDAKSWLKRLVEVNPSEVGEKMIWLSRYCMNPSLTISQLRQTASMVSPELIPNYGFEPPSTPTKQLNLTDSQAKAYSEIVGKRGYKLPAWISATSIAIILGATLFQCTGRPSSSKAYLHHRCEQAAGAEVCDAYHDNSAYPVLFVGLILMGYWFVSIINSDKIT